MIVRAMKPGVSMGTTPMANPQYTLTVALGVGNEGLKRRETYEKAANGKPLGQWVKEVLDEAAKKALKR